MINNTNVRLRNIRHLFGASQLSHMKITRSSIPGKTRIRVGSVHGIVEANKDRRFRNTVVDRIVTTIHVKTRLDVSTVVLPCTALWIHPAGLTRNTIYRYALSIEVSPIFVSLIQAYFCTSIMHNAAGRVRDIFRLSQTASPGTHHVVVSERVADIVLWRAELAKVREVTVNDVLSSVIGVLATLLTGQSFHTILTQVGVEKNLTSSL